MGCKAQAEVKVAKPPPPPPPPPPPDQDGDGIPDANDKCPAEAEDGNPPDAQDGCPNKDMDGDGILIPDDKCPDAKEVVNDFEDTDGCPDEKPLVQLKEKEVQINQKIQFKKDSAKIEEGSMPVVKAVAKLLKDYPEVQLIEVGGHASKEGSEWHNRSLTQKRVDSVVKELVKEGVDKSRLLSQGYGFYCPVDPGESEEALEKNRRVEFKILYRKGKDLAHERGCEAAKKKGIKPKKLPPIPEWKEPAKPAAPAAGAAAPAGGAAPAKGAAPAAGGAAAPAAAGGAKAPPKLSKPGAAPAKPAQPAKPQGAAPAAPAKPATPAKPAPAAPAAK
jgi:outer membrane protein OmpA-like peptidoglycan-associated protein